MKIKIFQINCSLFRLFLGQLEHTLYYIEKYILFYSGEIKPIYPANRHLRYKYIYCIYSN